MDFLALAHLSFVFFQFLATFVIKGLTALTGRRGTLLIGSALVFAACVAFWFLQSSHSGFVYPVIVSLGVGCAIVVRHPNLNHFDRL